jgi:transposase-like protein
VRQDNRVINKAVYLAVGVNMDGLKEVLGMWTAETEGAKFWLQVVTELKNRGSFPNDESMFKLMYLALQNIAKKWTMPIHNWRSALNQFSIMFEGRMPLL